MSITRSYGDRTVFIKLAIALALTTTVLGIAAALVWAWPKFFPPTPLELGYAAYARRDWREALHYGVEAVKLNPDQIESVRLLARASARLHRDESAQGLYQKIKPEEMKAEDYYLVGSGLMRQGNVQIARVVLNESLKKDPNYPESLAAIARIHAIGKIDIYQGIEIAQKLAKIPGWESRGDVIAAILLAEKGEARAVIEAVRRALKSDPTGQEFATFSLDSQAKPSEELSVYGLRKLVARSLLQLGEGNAAKIELEAVINEFKDRDHREAYWLLSRAELQRGDAKAAKEALDRAEGARAIVDPTVFEPAPYAGAQSCSECHKNIYHSQQEVSRHGKTFHLVNEIKDKIGLPSKPVVDPHNPRIVHQMELKGDSVELTTRDDERGKALHAITRYALGSGDKGLTFVGYDDRGKSRELRLSRYADIGGWDRTSGQTSKPENHDDYVGKPLGNDDLHRCLGCHTTNERSILKDQGIERYDHAIGCERCHGPAGNHLKSVALEFPDPAIGRPKIASAERRVMLCAQCHAPGGVVEPEGFDPAKPRYVRFQAATLMKSRCYTESDGKFDCMTCHNPHRDAQTNSFFYESKCLTCHSNQNSKTESTRDHDRSAPAKSCPVDAKQGCVKCHMPVVKTDMLHSPFTDHYIRVRKDDSASTDTTER